MTVGAELYAESIPVMPDNWGFFHDSEVVETAFMMSVALGRLPTMAEALQAMEDSHLAHDVALRKRLQRREDQLIRDLVDATHESMKR